jgi:hypothetical protein
VRARRFADARSAIERALALDPLNPRTWRAAGSIDLASGDLSKRLSATTDHSAGKLSNARAMKGYALIQLRRWADAKASLDGSQVRCFA